MHAVQDVRGGMTSAGWEGMRHVAIDGAAFEGLVESYHADLVRLAYAMTGDVELANDVAQTAWASAWQHRADLRDPGRVRGWLLTIAANQARAALRRRRLLEWLPFGAGEDRGEARGDDEGRLDLIAALQQLPVRDRQILALRYGLGETSAEVGRQVGLSDVGVRVRTARLIDGLRKELSDD